jgi:hypothetical protein
MRRSVLRRALAFVALAWLAVAATAGSETPPEGPPWTREFAAAQRDALKRGVPMFVYLTKTY